MVNKTEKKIIDGKWQILYKIKEGGQAWVYKVKEIETGKIYALKSFRVEQFQKEKFNRVKNEIESLIKLDGAVNVVKIYDNNLEKAIKNNLTEIYYVMDFAPHGCLKDNDFYFNDLEVALKIFKEILKGINSAHKAGIIHRDIKPENILFFPTQKEIVISDFGIGLLKEKQEHITGNDEMLGPMYFMSPEQFKDPSSANEKSDIYSLGKVLYFLLTGKGKVFREELDDLDQTYQSNNAFLPLIQENILKRMITIDPDQRFSDVSEIIEEVENIQEKIFTNTNRFIKKKEENFKFYDLFIAPEKQKFIDEFTKDFDVKLKELQYSLEDLNHRKKGTISKSLIDDLLKKYKGKVACAIKCVNSYVNNPTEIKQLEKGNSGYSYPVFFNSKYFFDNKSYDISHEYIEKALVLEKDSKMQLVYLLFFAEICKVCKCEKKHDFSERLNSLLMNIEDEDEKYYLYKILGKHYIEIDSKRKGLMYLEIYLQKFPLDNQIRWDCALQFSEIQENELSVYHYQIYLGNSKDEDNIFNNLGVIFRNEDMPIKAMEMYQKSFKLGNTLAGSNIASIYLSIGEKEHSLELLREIIRSNRNYDSNVDIILGTIPTNIKQEKEKLEKMEKTGNLLNKLHIEYVKHCILKEKYNWVGYWLINGRHVCEIKLENGALEFLMDKNSNCKIEGKLEDNCFEISQFELPYSPIYRKGILFLTDDDSFKGYAKNKDELVEIEAIRIKDIKKYLEQDTSLSGIIRSLKPLSI